MHNVDNQKKEIIVKAARELFFQFGFPKTSMEDIAAQSGLAKPTLYYYYENKEAIFNEIVMEEANRFIARLDAAMDAQNTVEEKMTCYFKTIYANLKKYAAELSKLPEALSMHSPHGQPVITTIHEMLRSRLDTLLEYGISEGNFHIKDKNIYKNTIFFMTAFLNHDWMRNYPQNLRDDVVHTMIEILIDGLKRRTV